VIENQQVEISSDITLANPGLPIKRPLKWFVCAYNQNSQKAFFKSIKKIIDRMPNQQSQRLKYYASTIQNR